MACPARPQLPQKQRQYIYHQLPEFRMLSKEQKIKYGELLRQQIKEKEEAKRAQKREHTPMMQPTILPQPHQRPALQSPPQEMNPDQFRNDREAQKELLAKRMEEQAYNPFGKVGSGAPNRQQNPRRAALAEEQVQGQLEEQLLNPDPARMNLPPPPLYQPVQGYRRIPTPEFLQGAYNNVPFVGEHYASPAPYGYVNVVENDINYLGKIDLSPRQAGGFEPRYGHLQLNPPPPQRPEAFYPPPPPPAQRASNDEEKRQQRVEGPGRMDRMDELQVFRKGGRNLLKFQNEVPQQIASKQNEKLRLQQELKKQMEEAARRKKEEEQRAKEEDERLERKNREFLELEKKKYEEELNAKKGQAKTVEEANANSKKEPANLKKEKFQKIREEVARREQEERRQAELKDQEKERQKENAVTRGPKQPLLPAQPRRNEFEEAESAISGETQMSRGFNTAISKQFFKREREKSGHGREKVDRLSSEMEKMRKEIAHQGQYYHREMEKVQREAERAKQEKERADEEIHRLKQELREKMDYNNKKFLEDIYHGKVQLKDPYYADQVTLQQPPARNTLRPRKAEQLVLQEYRPEEHRHAGHEERAGHEEPIMRNDSDMASLIGDSKKIPLELEANESLSISKLDRFAKDTEYFKPKKAAPPFPHKYRPQESILEEDERREESRQTKRGRREPEEELEKMMESRKKSRGGWGELSSVNEEMVNEIEHMLQDRQRPKSHLAKAGENSLQSYERPQKEKRRATSVSQEEQSEGTINSLDRLIQKYM